MFVWWIGDNRLDCLGNKFHFIFLKALGKWTCRNFCHNWIKSQCAALRGTQKLVDFYLVLYLCKFVYLISQYETICEIDLFSSLSAFLQHRFFFFFSIPHIHCYHSNNPVSPETRIVRIVLVSAKIRKKLPFLFETESGSGGQWTPLLALCFFLK